MQRRDFLKISAVTGAAGALDSCGNPEEKLIRFIPEEDLVPGVATWKPGLCTLCPAGCGLMVRVMEGEAEIVRKGRLGLVQMGLAKKLEGNPSHPVNQGKLCPRGQAGLQVTYHPDRITCPLKRIGERGSGQFREISWEEALKGLVDQLNSLRSAGEASSLTFVTRPLRGQRRALISLFLEAFGAPPAIEFELFDNAVLRHANALSFGYAQVPTLDLARTRYVISFGADFLGTWNSPVAQAIGYGQMRQGRPGLRSKFVQVESRMSQTGANADEWIPCRPGTEGVLALGLAHVILREKLASPLFQESDVRFIEGWAEGLPDYRPEFVEKRTGVPAAKVERIAREAGRNQPAVAFAGGAPLAHTNGLFNALAVNALHALIGLRTSVDQMGALWFMPQVEQRGGDATPPSATVSGSFSAVQALARGTLLDQPRATKVLLLYEANPDFGTPPGLQVREALKKIPFIASFGSFLDETSIFADLILPDHSFLESWLDDVPESGATHAVVTVAPPVVRPLHNTRALPDVLLTIAHEISEELSAALPWSNFEEMLRQVYGEIKEFHNPAASQDENQADAIWKRMLEQGGWWKTTSGGRFWGEDLQPTRPEPSAPLSLGLGRRKPSRLRAFRESFGRAPVRLAEPEFDGDAKDFPFYFLPFASQAFLDGSLAHLPWMQEMPDALSTAMWGTWVEINPKTAELLEIRQGDLVEVASRHGKLLAPALVSPGIAPDVVAMPVGQGHERFSRYASGRGSNPVAILAPLAEPETGSLAWAATRVKITRVGKGKLTLFAGGQSRFPHESEQR